MIQIRKNIFETNSSSSHAMVMLKEDKPIVPSWKEKTIMFWEDDISFGRSPFAILDKWFGRLCYAVANAAYNEDLREELEELCRKRIKGFDHFEFPRDYDDGYFYGYVDHQSMNLLPDFLVKHDISYEDFIFNDRYIVIIDGDEYCIFDALRQTPFWNENVIEVIENA